MAKRPISPEAAGWVKRVARKPKCVRRQYPPPVGLTFALKDDKLVVTADLSQRKLSKSGKSWIHSQTRGIQWLTHLGMPGTYVIMYVGTDVSQSSP